jgi:hypothetical protein
MANVKRYKFLGYCPKCSSMIGDADYEEGKKTILVCQSCNFRGREKDLKKERGEGDQPKTKKEFLESMTEIPSHYADYSSSDDIPDEFKEMELEDDWN